MSISNGLTIILGTGSIGDPVVDPQVRFKSAAEIRELLDVFHGRGGRYLDTARGYSPGAPGTCEVRLGNADVAGKFEVDTKLVVGEHGAEQVRSGVDDSLAKLNVEKVNTLYLHAPSPTTPASETLSAVTSLHASGRIARFGLSNHSAAQVAEFLDAANRNGYIRPSVCQDNYNVVMRGLEERLLPTLRSEGISLFAYSPAAGGLLNPPEYTERPNARWDKNTFLGKISSPLYNQPHLQNLAAKLRHIAASNNLTGHALALRWISYHSALDAGKGDGIVLGVSSVEQLGEDLDALEAGPLGEGVVEGVERAWREAVREREEGKEKGKL